MIKINLKSGFKMWLINYNANKCVVLTIRQSINYVYSLIGNILEVIDEQKYLGVTVCNNL